jgi:hypothetical protein
MNNKGDRQSGCFSFSQLWHRWAVFAAWRDTAKGGCATSQLNSYEICSSGTLLDLHQLPDIRMHWLRRTHCLGSWTTADTLRRTPVVDVGNLVHARDCAVRRTAFFRGELTPDIVDRVLLEGLGRISALLGAIVDQSILADI